jgi:dTMP kinase
MTDPAAIGLPRPRGALVSVEGISGVGKTYLTTRLLRDGAFTAISEFSERLNASSGALGHQILHALADEARGEHFLRSGHPGTETVLLIAVKTFDFEQCQPLLATGRTVIEGRSLDSIAVYQSLISHPDDAGQAAAEARQILALAARWRPLPDLTILLTNDVGVAVGRAEPRDSRPFTAEQRTLHERAAGMFLVLAADDPARFCVIDRRATELGSAIDLIRNRIAALDGRPGPAQARACQA